MTPKIDLGRFKIYSVKVDWMGPREREIQPSPATRGVTFDLMPDATATLRVSMRVAGRQPPHLPTDTVTFTDMCLGPDVEPEFVQSIVRRTLLHAFEKELDRWLTIDGEHVCASEPMPGPTPEEARAILDQILGPDTES